MPKYKPKIIKTGRKIQPKNKIRPKKTMKVSLKIPIKIKIALIIAPKTREIKLEKKASKYREISKPRP
jgi:hypothetical protein